MSPAPTLSQRNWVRGFILLGAFVASAQGLASTVNSSGGTTMAASKIVRIPRAIWRPAALDHQEKIRTLLQPLSLLPTDANQSRRHPNSGNSRFTALDPKNPIGNFFIEYYGLTGVKGPKRLARWSPSPNLLVQSARTYESLEEFLEASKSPELVDDGSRDAKATSRTSSNLPLYEGVFLEDISEKDLSSLLHLRGAILDDSGGALYSPFHWMNQKRQGLDSSRSHPASAYLWYRAILRQTLQAEPILNCHGLHEWAMQYQPKGQPPPPSAKYQAHLNLRVDRDIINETVERRGISCTHVDALRFFAPAAGPLNLHGATLQRTDQLRLEQPACVHAQMDLVKIALRLQPFCDADLFQRVLALSVDARRLDIAASPYDVREYGVTIVPVETEEGRALYRKEQRLLMHRAEPIRRELLDAYNLFLQLGFEEDPAVLDSQVMPADERFAKAEPGGEPWRRNLIAK